MLQILRDTPAGRFLRSCGYTIHLKHLEEQPDFRVPEFAITVGPAPVSQDGELIAPSSEKKLNISSAAHEKDDEEPIIVTWYSLTDGANPRNWSNSKKGWVMTVISLYTFVVYCTASIITPTVDVVMSTYNVSREVASLGLSIYVLGYAVGPMLFSPISEIPFVGRNPPYLYSFILFLVISIVLAVVDNFPAIIVLRFLQGYFGSPALASGGASIEDIYDMYSAPFGYVWWIMAMYCGPALGPLLAAYAISDNWRWALWEVVLMSGIVLCLLLFLPETSPSNIILNRAKRLRAITGNSYLAPSELQPLHFGSTLWQALIKPIEISIKDPAILFTVLYCALVYGTYYSFFEAFPLVYLGVYKMSQGGMGLIFTSLVIGCLIGLAAYCLYLKYIFIPRARHYHKTKGKPVPQEQWLRPGLIGTWGVSAGLFLFAWTAKESIHWIAPTFGIGIWAATSFAMFQSIICYVALTYPRYVASLFAANDLVRSSTAAALVQSTGYLYINLGINRGVSLVAGLSLMGVIGMLLLYYFGAQMRARSKFTG